MTEESVPFKLFRRGTSFSTRTFTSSIDPVRGYPQLAHEVGTEPSWLIFRRFSVLNARNLLYYQAELVQLEHELNDLEARSEGAEGGDSHHLEVAKLMNSEPGTVGYKQWEKVQEIRGKLEHYNSLLLQHAKLCKLPPPNVADFRELHKFIHGVYGCKWMRAPEDSIWEMAEDGKKHARDDLVVLATADKSKFQQWFEDVVLRFYHDKIYLRFLRRRKAAIEATTSYSHEVLENIVIATSVIISSLMPTISIFALYYIPRTFWRLVFILFFSILFSASLTYFTTARRIEVFTAAVALASVQVVFISNNSNNNYSS